MSALDTVLAMTDWATVAIYTIVAIIIFPAALYLARLIFGD